MKLRWIILCATTIALATGAIWYVYRTLSLQPSAAGTAVKDTSQPSVRTVNGETVVVVAPDAQRASHIEVTSLIDAPREQTRPAYATVLDLQPLFDLRSRFAAAQADLDTLTAQADNSRDQYARSRTLFEDDQNVSRKSVSDANAMMRANDAKLRSAKIAVAGLGATLRQQFGEALAAAAQGRADEEARPFVDVRRSWRPGPRQPWKHVAEQMRMQRRDKARSADDLADAIECQHIDGMLRIESIDLDVDGSRQRAPLSPLNINIEADAKVSLKLTSIFTPIGPSDDVNSDVHSPLRETLEGNLPAN